MLLSTTLQRAHGIEIGDPVRLTWAGQAPLSGHAAAFVDFWPAYDPHRDHLVVANLAYVHARMQIEPYELWAERANGANNRTILDGIDRAGVRITDLTDTGAKIGAARRDPMTLGLNGTLTIGFLLVTAISLRSRQAELAVVRSIGLSRRRVVAMVGWEQFLMALSAVIAGVVLGAVAARIYVPTMQVVTAAAERVPPLRVVALTGDFVRLYAIAAATFVAGALVVRGLIGRLRIHEAIRLGQE
jgi:putative ABC transport system permease protein